MLTKRTLYFTVFLICSLTIISNLYAQETLQISAISNSVLYSGQWKESSISTNKIHSLTQSDASNLGIELDQIAIFSNYSTELSKWNTASIRFDLVELPTLYTTTEAGESILYFYHPGTDSLSFETSLNRYNYKTNSFSKNAHIFITEKETPKRIELQTVPQITSENLLNLIDVVSVIKPNKQNLIQSGREFVSETIPFGNQFSQELTTSKRDLTSPVEMYYRILGKSESTSTFSISINNQEVETGNFTAITGSYGNYANERSGNVTSVITEEENLTVNVYTEGNSTGKTWINEIFLQTKAHATYDQSPLLIQNSDGSFDDFFEIQNTNTKLIVWSIENQLNPIQITNHSTNGVTKLPYSHENQQYLLFDPALVANEEYVWNDVDQNDILSTPDCEYLVVTHPLFLDQANRLARLYSNELTTKVVTTKQIYQIMSSGIPDVSAIRNYIRYIYNDEESSLRYVLLFGSGTYDNLSETGESNPNYIPTYQSENYLSQTSSFVSDDFFSLLSTSEGEYQGTEDIAVGRIPAISVEQATTVIDKIEDYKGQENNDEWLNKLCFVADDEDGNIHMKNTEEVAEATREQVPEMTIEKIYFDAFKKEYSPSARYPEVEALISKSINEGVFLFNYTGHSNEEGLAHEKVFNIENIEALTNENKLPIFVTASCDFTRWDYKISESAGEKVLFHEHGGGIALLSSSRLVYSSANYSLNKNFLEHLFNRLPNEDTRLGDVFLQAKKQTGGGINSRKFGLFGDPALQIKNPTNQVIASRIDQNTITNNPLISVLEEHTIEGNILDESGTINTNFSDDLSIRITGGEKYSQTLGNGGEIPFTYRDKPDLLFQSTTVVENGQFSTQFILPLDVDYTNPEGMFVFSSFHENKIASGTLSPFTLTDPLENTIDLNGPDVDLYLQNTDFKNNDVVGINPILYANLHDESGINTSEYGIGHDMEIVIDGDTSNPIVVSEGYTADPTNFKEGRLKWQLTNLAQGEHTIKLRVWDNANNASEETISFTVNQTLQLYDLLVYPNPVKEQFSISFQHNKAMENLDVEVNIYNSNGKIVFTKTVNSNSTDNTIAPILISAKWANLTAGIYLLKVRVNSMANEYNEQSTKLIVQ